MAASSQSRPIEMRVYETESKLDRLEKSESFQDPDLSTAQPVSTIGQEGFWTRLGLTPRSLTRRDTNQPHLDRKMSKRHLNMIAIGGSIGAGFFVGSGGALATGGPGSLLIDFLIVGVMMFNVVYALGELAVLYPVAGSFYTYADRFIDPSWGFAMGWNYVMQWAVVLPLELTVCGITIGYWDQTTSVGVWIVVFLTLIVIVNAFGTLGYAEEEFWGCLFKLCATVVFLIIAFLMVMGIGPASGLYHGFVGGTMWQKGGAQALGFTVEKGFKTIQGGPLEGGAFAHGFLGFCGVFVTAAFAFSGTELVGLAAAEAKNPVASLPGAIKQIFWRVTTFYVLGLLFIGLLIPCDDPHLMSADSMASSDVSPFVLMGKYAGLNGLDHLMNVVILVSVLSIGVSAVYGGSRCLTALAQEGWAPPVFKYIDKSGRPLFSVLAILVFGLLAFVNLSSNGATVFEWLLSLSGLASLFTWGSICLAHIRFRAAWKHNGRSLDEIPFKALGGVYGSYLGLILIILVLIAQLYTAIEPRSIAIFFQKYLTVPVIAVFYLVGYVWKRKSWRKLSEIDVSTGLRDINWPEIEAHRALVASWPAWRRFLHKVW